MLRAEYEPLIEKYQQAALSAEQKTVTANQNWQDIKKNFETLSDQHGILQTNYDHLLPWAKKWKHDSQRGFIKVMFGAGKDPVPDVPMPLLE